MISGVPQGSVMGPLLFILFIDDLTETISKTTKISLFADDAKIYGTNPKTLQHDINSMCTFLDNRQLQIAPDKCEHLTLSKKKNKHHFFIRSKEVHSSTSVKDLGVTISKDLKWTEHINNIKLKAFRTCQHILRSFHSNNIWTLLRAYTVYVRPVLETASVVWNPIFIKDIKSLESVQRYYTRRICCRCNISFSSYADRLYKLNIKSIQYRRLEADIIMVYKMVHQLVDIPMNDFFRFYTSPYMTRRHRYCLEIKRCTSKNQQGFLVGRVAKVWNALPANLVEETPLKAFRLKLKRFDLNAVANLVCF